MFKTFIYNLYYCFDYKLLIEINKNEKFNFDNNNNKINNVISNVIDRN